MAGAAIWHGRIPKNGILPPGFGAKTDIMSLADFMLSRRQQALLAALLLHPERSFSVSELISLAGPGRGATQLALKAMIDAGVLARERLGNQVRLKGNEEFPLYPELRAICVKSFGVADEIRKALLPLADRIRFAFIFGSIVRGTGRRDSDVELFLVGEASMSEVSLALEAAEKALGRHVRMICYGTGEWPGTMSDAGVSSILRGPKIALLGDPANVG
jgi:predicted nucleotidyltransferase